MNRRRKDFTSNMKLEFFVVLLVSNRHISMKGNRIREDTSTERLREEKKRGPESIANASIKLFYHLVDSSVFCSPEFFLLTEGTIGGSTRGAGSH